MANCVPSFCDVASTQPSGICSLRDDLAVDASRVVALLAAGVGFEGAADGLAFSDRGSSLPRASGEPLVLGALDLGKSLGRNRRLRTGAGSGENPPAKSRKDSVAGLLLLLQALAPSFSPALFVQCVPIGKAENDGDQDDGRNCQFHFRHSRWLAGVMVRRSLCAPVGRWSNRPALAINRRSKATDDRNKSYQKTKRQSARLRLLSIGASQ